MIDGGAGTRKGDVPGQGVRRASRAASLLALLFFVIFLAPARADETESALAAQRKLFVEAQRALDANRISDFKQLLPRLRDYPLYPYLLHDYLRPRLRQEGRAGVEAFLQHFGDLPMAGDLRREWLKILAQRGQWQAFLDNYTPQRDTTLQCYQLLARIRTGNDAYLLEDTRTLWLSATSQPPQCDAAFERLEKSPLMTDELVWSRIELAMSEGETSLASYLGDKLPDDQQHWVARWIATYHNPARWMADPDYPDTKVTRAILVDGEQRLARVDFPRALKSWEKLRGQYDFTKEQRAEVGRLLAIRAAQRGDEHAGELLGAIRNEDVDETILNLRLRTALQDYDWKAILDWTSGEVPRSDDAVREGWIYWRARALEQTGDRDGATRLYESLVNERDYYAFMASDRLGTSYEIGHHPLPEDMEAWHRLSDRPSIQRARELYLLDMLYSAGREWNHALEGMTTYQMQIAALIASNWGWHYRVIMTMAKAQAFDDLVLRFPVPYEKELREFAGKRDLDLAWVFALVRAESAFLETARSPTGALGLMQVMPATGKQTAHAIGLKHFTPKRLLDPDTNIPIGTAYLRQMVNRFGGNLVLATAAYNAGPGSVSRWMPQDGCTEPDVWIERIPLLETRKYVQRILYYSSIYDWRLGQDVVPLNQRMAAVQPAAQKQMVASLSCPAQRISMN